MARPDRIPVPTDPLRNAARVSRRRLSVVIPTWNRARLVCEAVESVLRQEGGDLEVIVVDDGSTDGTAEAIERRFGKSVKLLRMATRSGVGAARNEGVGEATGDLLAFLDSDDLWLPGKLNAELDVLERFPDAEAIVSDSRFIADGQSVGTSKFADNGALAATGGRAQWVDDSPWLWTIPSNGVSTCAITLCRRAVTKLGQPLFATDLHFCEDWELEVRLYQECRVVALPEVFSHVRWINDGTRIGRVCPGQPRSPEQEIGLLRAQLTVIERSIRPGRLTADLAHALEDFRCRISSELARLEAARA
jgi:glycosyltransferase involved in cell wall biosynthesis